MSENFYMWQRSTRIGKALLFWRKFRWFVRLAVACIVSAGIFAIFFALYLRDNTSANYIQNIAATVVGTIFTVTVLEARADKREEKALIQQMGSPANQFALEAVRLLKLNRMIYDGSLNRAILAYADLKEADLQWTNLHGVVLGGAILYKAKLFDADLSGANLSHANLEEANLEYANMKKVNLTEAKLKCANLMYGKLNEAWLQGANLTNANLEKADLAGATLKETYTSIIEHKIIVIETIFSSETTLPDGSKWSNGRDMREFTHPKEWKAEQAAKKE